MPTIFARVLLFISSYCPLFVIFGFLYLRRSGWFSFSCFAVAVLGLLGLIGFLQYVQREDNPESLTLKSATPRDEQSMSYIISYIIPFLAITTSSWEQQAALAVFFLMIAVLYVKTNMIHINPAMYFLRYRIYEIELTSGKTHTLVTKRRICPPETISAFQAGEHFFVEKKQ